ncbi:MAG: hypothetical protein JSS83_29135, partial [Cyanobacteria bacterium SZAS LIN-3]|nr:hypothetical protein [Cyanobacteria bacterium SZAS LIN-3]
LKVTQPSLPQWLDNMTVNGLRMGDSEVNLTLRRTTTGATTVEISRVKGNVRCLVEY